MKHIFIVGCGFRHSVSETQHRGWFLMNCSIQLLTENVPEIDSFLITTTHHLFVLTIFWEFPPRVTRGRDGEFLNGERNTSKSPIAPRRPTHQSQLTQEFIIFMRKLVVKKKKKMQMSPDRTALPLAKPVIYFIFNLKENVFFISHTNRPIEWLEAISVCF